MSYCLKPSCPNPQNPNKSKFCQICGTKLLLAERYRAIKLIGAGGFGRTLLAHDEYKPSQPCCVIKQFYPQGQNNAGKAAELFQQEAVRLEQLGKHDQIPELLAHFEQDSRQYIVQEFINGQNLAEELAETGAFREDQIRSLLRDLLPLLQFIHNRQVIHRDIKPDNIIRHRSDGKLVLLDFGAAKYATGTALGKTGTIIGSAGYAAPEQNFGQAVFASDIYSLGVTCIHLLTDIEPFKLYDAKESAFVWRHHLANNQVSEQLGRILDKMTQSLVKQRYQSASAVMQALGLKVGTQNSNNKPRLQSKPKVIQPPAPLVGTQSTTPAPVLKPSSLIKASPLPPVQSLPPQIAYKNISLIATLSGSKGSIKCVAISPDGQKVAGGSGIFFSWFAGKDNSVKIWDIDSGKLVHTLTGHSSHVNSVAFSPDGLTVASGCYKGTIKLWDVRTGQEKFSLNGYSVSASYAFHILESLAFSPDGLTVASGSFGSIKLWDVRTAKEKHTLIGHSNWVKSLAFSPDGETLASGCGDCIIKLWDVRTGQEKRTLKGDSGCINCVTFSPNGQTIVSASNFAGYTINLWDVHTGQEKRTIRSSFIGFESVAFSLDGQTLASCCGYSIRLWDINTWQEISLPFENSGSIHSVVFTSNGQILVSGSKDNIIKIWRVTVS